MYQSPHFQFLTQLLQLLPAVHIEGIMLRSITHGRTDKEYSFQVGVKSRAPVSRFIPTVVHTLDD